MLSFEAQMAEAAWLSIEENNVFKNGQNNLNAHIQANGLKLLCTVPGDGDCFYASLDKLLGLNKEAHFWRVVMCLHCIENYQRFSLSYNEANEFFEKHLQNGVYADRTCIEIMAECLEARIFVHAVYGESLDVHVDDFTPVGGRVYKEFHLGYVNSHYSPLVPQTSVVNALPHERAKIAQMPNVQEKIDHALATELQNAEDNRRPPQTSHLDADLQMAQRFHAEWNDSSTRPSQHGTSDVTQTKEIVVPKTSPAKSGCVNYYHHPLDDVGPLMLPL